MFGNGTNFRPTTADRQDPRSTEKENSPSLSVRPSVRLVVRSSGRPFVLSSVRQSGGPILRLPLPKPSGNKAEEAAPLSAILEPLVRQICKGTPWDRPGRKRSDTKARLALSSGERGMAFGLLRLCHLRLQRMDRRPPSKTLTVHKSRTKVSCRF